MSDPPGERFGRQRMINVVTTRRFPKSPLCLLMLRYSPGALEAAMRRGAPSLKDAVIDWHDLTTLFLEQRKELAASLNEAMRSNREYCLKSLTHWVEANPEGNELLYVGCGVGGQTAVDFTTLCGTVLTDLLTIGEGSQRGGWGYGADALRALNFIPAAKVAQWINLKRLTVVAQDAKAPYCTWVAVTQGFNLTSTKLFASVQDMARMFGLDSSIAGATFAPEFVPLLSKLKIAHDLFPEMKSPKDIMRFIKRRPNGAFVFAMDAGGIPHTVVGFWEAARGAVVLVGRGGKICIRGSNLSTVAEEFKVLQQNGQYANATLAQLLKAKPTGQMLFLPGARFAALSKGRAISVFSQIVVRLRGLKVRSDQIHAWINQTTGGAAAKKHKT